MIYEVEIKIELTKDEKEKLERVLKERSFDFRGQTPQRDYYVEAERSPYYEQGGAYNLKRYRNEDGKIVCTTKVWEMVEGDVVRQEEEYEVSEEKLEEEIHKHPDLIKIEKTRDWYWGEFRGEKISLTIDAVDFDHSPNTRYFFEAEIGVSDKGKIKESKKLIEDFVKELLEKEKLIEAPGMFTVAFEKR